jgi:probable HAF family extracellular repeat protein
VSWCNANGVNADGTVVVGASTGQGTGGNGEPSQAFRWTAAGGMVGLGFLPGDNFSYATAVNADGAVVVGESVNANTNLSAGHAFRWTAAGGMVGLGFLPGYNLSSDATGVNANGDIVVGVGESASGLFQAFRWTAESGMVGLGGLYSEALAERRRQLKAMPLA